jgi:hypothetical protein
VTVKQKKCLLFYLGYYFGEIDDKWDDACKRATSSFQSDFGGIEVDGLFGSETGKAIKHAIAYGMPEKEKNDFWDEIEFFKREEFRCQCGGKYCNGFPVEPDEKMVRYANEIRKRLGVPVEIVDAGGSGVRCYQHNLSIKGAAKNSQHLYGKAADLHSSKTPEEMYRVAEEVIGDTGGIGLYSWGIHIDSRSTKARWNG